MLPAMPEPLWTPTPEQVERTTLTRYTRWLEAERGLRFDGYHELWNWSTSDVEAFWQSVWDFFEVRAARPPERVLGSREMPGASWFPGAELSFPQHVLDGKDDAAVALVVLAWVLDLVRSIDLAPADLPPADAGEEPPRYPPPRVR